MSRKTQQKNLKLELSKSEAKSLVREIENLFDLLGIDRNTSLIDGLKMVPILKKSSEVDQEKVHTISNTGYSFF